MNRRDFYFALPPHLIAQQPAAERTASRLMRLDRQTGAVSHGLFSDIIHALRPGDCLVLNDTKVIPARLLGRKDTPTSANGRIEMLLHKHLHANQWEVLVKPGRKCRPGDRLIFGAGELTAHIDSVKPDGLRIVSLSYAGLLEPLLDKLGEMPLPHYIKTPLDRQAVKHRYQTVYATHDGSVAAPTAGLHFSHALLQQIQQMGVQLAYVTLHVGLGTFRPVKVEDITQHTMHSEYFHIAPEQADMINQAKRDGRRIIAVGTTSCRTLESAAADNQINPGTGQTDIFIYPGYSFRIIDGLITNFHLPESTLLMLVAAFCGRETILRAYQTAIEQEYRFYSFGDAMAIL